MINKFKIFFRKTKKKYDYWRCKKEFKKYWINMPHGYLTDEQIKIFDDREKELEAKIRKDLIEYFRKIT